MPVTPLDFVGVPDWRSLLLSVAFALPWLALLARGWLRRGWVWVGVGLGTLLFPVSIAWVQVPAQQALTAIWQRLLTPAALQQWMPLISLPSLLVASVVQEGAKLLVALAVLWRLDARQDRSAGLAAGAAAGAGYGAAEAFWVFNLIFSAGLTWATVQLQGPLALLGFVERLFAVPFHVGTGALLGYGLAAGRPGRYFLLAVTLHTVSNYAVVLVGAGALSPITAEVWAAAVAAVTVGLALRLRARSTA
ncbi:MAG: hypothetical protein ACUVT2_11310 [Thiobacillaceae bacterium]